MTRKQYQEMMARYQRAKWGQDPRKPRPEPVLGIAGVIARDRRESAEQKSEPRDENPTSTPITTQTPTGDNDNDSASE